MPASLTQTQKAALIYRVLETEGMAPPLERFAEPARSLLAAELAAVDGLDPAVVSGVVSEFLTVLDRPAPVAAAPPPLPEPGPIPMPMSAPLPGDAPVEAPPQDDPWDRVLALDADELIPLLEAEAPEVGAVILSKLRVSHAADLLGRLPGPLARRIAHGVSRVSNIAPDVVAIIGESLARAQGEPRQMAFSEGPVERVGAILNSARALTRNDVLTGLDETDPDFAEAVRRSIFTFSNIPSRIAPRDIPKIVRQLDQRVLVTALAGVGEDAELAASAEFILGGLPQRMRDALSAEIAETGEVREADAERAMAEIVGTIRGMEDAGEIYLVAGDDDG